MPEINWIIAELALREEFAETICMRTQKWF